ncbi:hypothetical protein HMPREF0004_0504 [Achromobacter piechaudii ATCC 43553]|uniref:Uncharacterized protein n=1 Tax=Achromobacter piechaudii ATCC 43553 TaxID=742159 RepID=D4X4V7_9BURK|nr:hypothetical protein HMPREF0004_0504 [Achromobacter piechaudii ATCC 43553]
MPFRNGFGSEEKVVIGHRCVLGVRPCRRRGSRGALHPGLHECAIWARRFSGFGKSRAMRCAPAVAPQVVG